MIRLRMLVVFLAVVAIVGCKQRVVTQPEHETQQPPAKQETQEAKDKSGKIPEEKVASVEAKDLEAASLKGEEGLFADIHFDYDKYDIKEADKHVLHSIATWMSKNTGAVLSVEGHCDERGTNEYNLALGDRRAKAVRDALISLGVPSAKIETISYGEEKPLCTEQTEQCWAKNRRAHFVVLRKAGK